MKAKIERPKNKNSEDLSDHYPILSTVHGLKVVSYNLQLLPSYIKNFKKDIRSISDEFAQYFKNTNADICCVQELFDSNANTEIIRAMSENGYCPSHAVGKGNALLINGGVRIFVKKKFAEKMKQYTHIYQNKIDMFSGGDAMSSKGISHITVINDAGKKCHFFNTHLQASYDEREHYSEITLSQCIELKRFIQKQTSNGIINKEDPIVICGDFNIHKPKSDKEITLNYKKLIHIFGSRYSILDYEQSPGFPAYTQTNDNTNVPDSNQNKNLDYIINYKHSDHSDVDIQLEECFTAAQMRISQFVIKNATLLTWWKLSDDNYLKLNEYNRQYEFLIEHSEHLKNQKINPMDDADFLEMANQICLQPPTPRFKMPIQLVVATTVTSMALYFQIYIAILPCAILFSITAILAAKKMSRSTPDLNIKTSIHVGGSQRNIRQDLNINSSLLPTDAHNKKNYATNHCLKSQTTTPEMAVTCRTAYSISSI